MEENDGMGREDALNALFPLMIPTYDGSGEAAHPSVLYFTSRWNRYRYWMAFTPYRGTNEKYENPSIVVSNDGIHWIQPKGLINPIIGKPEDGHLSDPNLFFDFHKRLSMFYRKRYRLENGRGYDERFFIHGYLHKVTRREYYNRYTRNKGPWENFKDSYSSWCSRLN